MWMGAIMERALSVWRGRKWPVVVLTAALSVAPASGQPRADATALELMSYLANRDPDARERAAALLGERGDPSVVPAFLEALQFLPPGEEWHRAMKRLTGERFGSNWHAWMEWLGGSDLSPHPDYPAFKRSVLQRIDPALAAFFSPGAPMRIRFDLVVWGGVPVDGIPALDTPPVVAGAEATYLTAEEPVFGVRLNGEARAYPLRILDWHEMVNDTLGGRSITLAYCTLCGSAILFDAHRGDTVFTFGSSGLLYDSNKLMYDRPTRSLWSTLHGRPVAGPLVGSGIELRRLPIVRSEWASWRRRHPRTSVLSIETGFDRDYQPGTAYGEYFASDETMFPVARRSERLEPKAWVYGVELDGIHRAYPLEFLEDRPVVNDAVGPEAVLVLSDAEQLSVRVYRREELAFSTGEAGTLVDLRGGTWEIGESYLERNGRRLPRVAGHLAFWFAWYAFFPETTLYDPH